MVNMVKFSHAFILIFCLFIASDVNAGAAKSSLMSDWQAARVGLFLHWGPWSRTGHGSIWDQTQVTDRATAFGAIYENFVPRPETADLWMAEASAAGMRYVVLTAKHHDGYLLWPSQTSTFGMKADFITTFVKAADKANLIPGLYFSIYDWHDPDGAWHSGHPAFNRSYLKDHPDGWTKFLAMVTGQLRELTMGQPSAHLLWLDGDWPEGGRDLGGDIVAKVAKTRPDMLVNDRGRNPHPDFRTGEALLPRRVPAGAWEMTLPLSRPVTGGFWYRGPEADPMSARALVQVLSRVVSRGGNLLLGVGPAADGAFSPRDRQRLIELGLWLGRNGRAIYGTKACPFSVYPPGVDGCTVNNDVLYLHFFDWPAAPIELPLKGNITGAQVLGRDDGALEFGSSPTGVRILPRALTPDPYVTVVAVTLKTGWQAEALVLPTGDGSINWSCRELCDTRTSQWSIMVSHPGLYGVTAQVEAGQMTEDSRLMVDGAPFRIKGDKASTIISLNAGRHTLALVNTTVEHNETPLTEMRIVRLNDDTHVVIRLRDLTQVRDALARYYDKFGAYPTTNGRWDGYHSNFGTSSPDWIQGLVPEFLPALPRDPAREERSNRQYLYVSNGVDYKLIAHSSPDCSDILAALPAMVDNARKKLTNCWGYGYWTPGAAMW